MLVSSTMSDSMIICGFSERFCDELWFKQPQKKELPTIQKATEMFYKVDLKKVGGMVTKEMSKRNFDRFKTAYEYRFFDLVNDFLKIDI